ncbi:alanine--glyoxylate aminotransferase family protein [Marispirochaeta sp.]|uniref:pyridoxal-phosphate-dependent aminotransferase family protein n=1 Tax=Marispirochaeta sp. TaxID=2038653 RepID=UPI0029C93DDD|nr:alanine--glyoxylate aminotransferase family protein [Marispirochaeta sp.]
MENKLKGIEEILLMGPGPSLTYPKVYEAMARPTLGHLDPYFIKIMDGIKEMLQAVFQTKNALTIPVSGTGSAGMETVLVNLIEPGDPVLIIINGVFGKRQLDIAQRLGAEADALEFTWGKPVDPDTIAEALGKKKYRIVSMVHAETSTGVCNPAEDVGELVASRGNGAFYVLDTVTSLGGMEVNVDAWKVDAVYSGTQKCLSCPPGLAPVSFSQRAVDSIMNRRTRVPNWYLDMSMVANYWAGKKRAYHHTAPINMLYGLYQALYLVLEEGLEKIYRRHTRAHEQLVAGLEELGMSMVVESPYRLPMLNAVRIPEGIDDAETRNRLRSEYKIEIGGGLGDFAGKVWRIGLMGNTARKEHVDRLLKALKEIIQSGNMRD